MGTQRSWWRSLVWVRTKDVGDNLHTSRPFKEISMHKRSCVSWWGFNFVPYFETSFFFFCWQVIEKAINNWHSVFFLQVDVLHCFIKDCYVSLPHVMCSLSFTLLTAACPLLSVSAVPLRSQQSMFFPWHSVSTACETRFDHYCWWWRMKSTMKDGRGCESILPALKNKNWSSLMLNQFMDSELGCAFSLLYERLFLSVQCV